jgi:hypothetical protein
VSAGIHAALDFHLPGYANAIMATNDVVKAISSFTTSGIGAQY